MTLTDLLNYSADEVALTAICQGILDNLAENGMSVYFGQNPSCRHKDSARYEKYGVKIDSITPTAEGLEINFSVLQGLVSFVTYQLPMSTYERALAHAGFTRVEWLPLQVSDEGVKEFDEEFWIDAVSDHPLHTVMRAR